MKKRFVAFFTVLLLGLNIFSKGVYEPQQIKPENFPPITDHKKNPALPSSSDDAIIDRDMATLSRLYKYVQKNFLYEIDHNKVYEAMATALFDSLDDKYSYFVKSDKVDEYQENTFGLYGGLGFYFSKNFINYQDSEDESTLYCNITQVFPNTPSARGGMMAGDMITAIDGESVKDMEANDCAKLMKGEVGSDVTVTVKRGNSSFDLTLTRELIHVPTIEYCMLDNNTAYILILEFSSDTAQKTVQALTELAEQGMQNLIIDLRDNPGGEVESALKIANLFLSSDTLLTVSYKDSSKNVIYKATEDVFVDPSVNVVILVNGGTASCAEILSSTMRDNGRAVLVGSKTFGKGIMQVVSSFGDAYTSITIASFVPPSGNEIHKVGVPVDYEVESLTVEENERESYKILSESDLLQKYIESAPEFTKENIENFAVLNPQTGIRPEVLNIIVRNEYLRKMNYDERPKADTWFDPAIKKALELF
mgnify:CR=1 FL=1